MTNIDDELIDLVEANPCLYNVNMEEYRNQTLKNGVWNQIADKLQLDVETSDTSPPSEEKDRVLKQMDDLIKSIMAEKEPDSIDLFCDALKDDLRQVPPEIVPLCKAQIMNVVAENISRRRT
uniref:CSON012689 protein n=1 Tax=Culicoides sonorensis TaxID=179676 RepID=A0A336KLL7_CULSO